MTKKQTSPAKRYVLGRSRFSKISEVEGIRLTASMKRAFAEFDRKGMSAAERRRDIVRRFRPGRPQDMSKIGTTRVTVKPGEILPRGGTDWARLDTMSDEGCAGVRAVVGH